MSKPDTNRDMSSLPYNSHKTEQSAPRIHFEGADHRSLLGNELHAQQMSDAVLDIGEAAQTSEPLSQ